MERNVRLESLSSIVQQRLERQRHRRREALQKRKSVFKQVEEQSQLLQAKRKDRLNSLTATSAKSWIARKLISNAALGITGGFRRYE